MLALVVTGCATSGASDLAASTSSSASSGQAAEISRKAEELARREAELARQAQEIEQARKELAASSGTTQSPVGVGSNLLPPDPRPGECYARVIIPAQYKTTTETVLKREAAERIEVIPAKYGPLEKSVLVKEAATKLEVVPAVYEEVQETVMVKPASKEIVEVPAQYETVTETVLDKAAHTVWKRGTGIGAGSGDAVGFGGAAALLTRFGDQKILDTRVDDTGEVMCLVEVPASYRTITKQVLVSPATTREVEIPAEYKTVTKRVLKHPATTREVTIPAEYKTITVTELLEPPKEHRIPIPEEYETLTKTAKISEERIEWRPVLCEVNMTRQNVTALQTSLKEAGCYECRVDGVMGPCTLKAARCYADRNGLPAGDNYVTIEVIKSLGLTF